jgi:predicted MPP superfamily phosphohydrolase
MQVGPLSFYEYLTVSVIVIGIAGMVPFLAPLRGRTLARLLVSASLMLVTLAVSLGVLGQNRFAGFHIIYGSLTCAVPAVGVCIIATTLVKRYALRRALAVPVAVACFVPAVLGFYATNIEPRMLVVDHFALGTPQSSEHLKIVVVSDIQSPSVGGFERKVVRTATEQQGDLVLFPGDLYSGEDEPFPRHFDDFTQLVSGLNATYGTYFVPGDHDGDDTLPVIVEAAGKTFLQEHLQIVDVRGKAIGILGLDTDYSSRNARALMQELAERDDLDYKIVLDHKPDVIFHTPPGVDLVIAGHTHGGQVNVPLVGPLVTLSEIPRQQAAGGLFTYPNGTELFVTRGVGVEHGEAPFVRFNAKPQIAVLDIGL